MPLPSPLCRCLAKHLSRIIALSENAPGWPKVLTSQFLSSIMASIPLRAELWEATQILWNKMVSLCFPYGRWLSWSKYVFANAYRYLFVTACIFSPITCVCDPRGHVYNCFPTDTKVRFVTPCNFWEQQLNKCFVWSRFDSICLKDLFTCFCFKYSVIVTTFQKLHYWYNVWQIYLTSDAQNSIYFRYLFRARWQATERQRLVGVCPWVEERVYFCFWYQTIRHSLSTFSWTYTSSQKVGRAVTKGRR